MTYEFCPLWDMFLFTQVVFWEENQSYKTDMYHMTDTVLGSTIIIHSNSRSVLLIELTGSLLLLWDVSFPAPSSAVILAGFSWGDINIVRTAKWVGTNVCPNQPQEKSLRTADLTLVVS